MSLRIANFAEIVAVSRTHVYREGFGSRNIEYVPEPEANTRIAKGLAGIARGIAALNQQNEVAEQDLQDVFRVGLDCIPEIRRRVLIAAITNQPFDSVGAPYTTTNHAIQELVELDILDKEHKLSKKTQKLLEVADLKVTHTVRGG